MRNALTPMMITLALAAPAASSDVFSLRITEYPRVVVRGLPVRISGEIRNTSGGPVTVAYSPRYIYPHTAGRFAIFARATDVAVGDALLCEDPSSDEWIILGPPKPLPAGWHEELSMPVCITAAGTYKVELVAASQGPYSYFAINERIQVDAWSGEARSEAVTITIQEPTGVDLAAFEYFKDQILDDPPEYGMDRFTWADLILQKFPTSTYAAHVVWQVTAKGVVQSKPEGMLQRLAAGPAGNVHAVLHPPCDEPPCQPETRVGSFKSLSGEACVTWRQKWFDIVLKAHPDIWLADELRFVGACDQFLLGNSSAGAAGLEALAKNGRPDVAEKAKQLLALAREKGLVQ